MRIEQMILWNLLHNEEYYRRVLPYLESDYFKDYSDKYILKAIIDFESKYATQPTKEVILLEIERDEKINEETYENVQENLKEFKIETRNIEWLVEATEKFCKDKAIYNAIIASISIIDGSDTTRETGSISDLLTTALGISFNTHIGHDFFINAEERFEFYNLIEKRIPFDLEIFNEITGGGFPEKTLNVIIAGCVHPKTPIRVRITKDTEN